MLLVTGGNFNIRKSILLLLILIACGILTEASGNEDPVPEAYVYKVIGSDSLKAFVLHPPDIMQGKRYPTMAIFHGGGWAMGEASWGFGRARRFAEKGMISVSVQYRISDQKSVTPAEAMEDSRDFFIWSRENAETLGIAVDSLAAYGWSAGTHLIASAAVFRIVSSRNAKAW